MRQRLKRAVLIGAVLLTVMLAATAANTWRQWAGLTAAPDTPAARRARLEPFWRIVPAVEGHAGAGRAVLLSGCDGVHDNMDFWAARFADRGWPALILDSHDPRGLDQYESWRLVCIGQVLGGAERAGDLAVALASPVLPAGGAVVEALRPPQLQAPAARVLIAGPRSPRPTRSSLRFPGLERR